ncbi:MAG: PKD domain-containing protein [Bacteroidia bacterium]|nr:PKD domain-containing protein [Bacteroidia bacterium]
MRFRIAALTRLFFAFTLTLSFYPLFSQSDHQDYHLNITSGSFVPAENLEEVLDNPGFLADQKFAGRIYVYLQFYQVPLQELKDKMVMSGISFLDYLPEKTYIASFPENYPLQNLRDYGVRSLLKIDPEFKLDARLLRDEMPVHAIADAKNVDLNISYYRDLDPELVAGIMRTYFIPVLGRNDYANLLTVRVPASVYKKAATYPFVAFVEPVDPPAEAENYTGRTLHRSNVVAADYGAGRHYDGTGVIVALGDDGIIGPHIDYTGRLDETNVSTNSGDHGDHCAGIIMGAGNLDPLGRGNAFGVTLWNYSVWDAINSTPTSYTNPGVRITSTSYSNGCNAGYTTFARTADQQIRQMPNLIHVFSAGNNGTSDCGYGAGANWGNVTGGVKVGKNVIAVANLDANDNLATSSSRGPAHDGRIKPELAAKGTNVYSTYGANAYAYLTGTSMACPGVSGNFAQLIHAYRSLNGNADPESALIKACLMNTAEDIGNPGPDFKHGYGRINSLAAVKTLEQNRYTSQTISQGQTKTHTIAVPSGTAEVRAMIYWHDYEAAANASTALVNNLNMTLTTPTAQVYNPWKLDHTPNPTNLNANATRGVDNLNNMEQVTLANPVAGNYTVTVTGPSVPQGPQKYWLVWEFRTTAVDLTYPIGGEGLVPGETEKIRWDAYGNSGTFTVQYSTNNGSTWSTIATNVSSSQRYLDWVVPSITPTGLCRVRVTRGTSTDQSDANFSIINVPTNLTVPWACPDTFLLSWNPVAGATGYEVSMLGNKYMDFVGQTSATSYAIGPINFNNTYWVSVKALGPNGAIGRRAIAINKGPGTWNCPIAIDAAVTQIISPSGNMQNCAGLGASQVKIALGNSGINSLTAIPVHYQVNGGAIINETIAGPLSSGNSLNYTFTQTINLNTPGTYQIKAWASKSGDGNHFNDTTTTTVNVSAGTLVSLPYSEDFETFALCGTTADCEVTVCAMANGWTNEVNLSQDDIDWRTDEGGTPSTGTGPTTDYNPGTTTGNYLYLEASGTCAQKVANLLSPCIDLTNSVTPTLTFAYHMYGTTMGELHVDVLSGGTWTQNVTPAFTGNHGNVWNTATVNLSAFNGNIIAIRFRGITGTGFESDIAIDDIQIVDPNAPIIADFYANLTSVCPGETVSFTDLSNTTPTSWTWSISPGTYSYTGGTNASSQNPKVIFANTGSYTVTLTSGNGTSTDTETKVNYIQVGNGATLPLSEDFESFGLCSTNPDCGVTTCPISGIWTNEPNGVVDDIDWRVDEGGTPSQTTGPSIDHDPGTSTGNYVYLEASNGCTTTVAHLVTGCIDLSTATNPTLNFWYHMYGSTQGTLHVDIDTAGTWINDIMTPISGDKGDIWKNAIVNLSNYAGGTVKLRIRGETGNGFWSDMALDDILIEDNTCPPIGSAFSYTVNGTVVSFADQSSSNPTNWYWDFGDGQYAYTQNPSHNYYSNGAFTVCMTAWNNCDADTLCQQIVVNCLLPNGGYSYSVSGNTVTFLDQSGNGASQWLWIFDDGSTSTLQNPVHTYSQPGTYHVCVEAWSSCGMDSVCQQITIGCPSIVAAFSSSVSGSTVSFNDLSTNNPTNWYWDFGDGQYAYTQNPNHTYANNGVYTVCMTAWNSCDSDTLCQQVTVNCALPTGGFTYVNNGLTYSFTSQAGNGANQFYWNFGDGSYATSQNATHTYSQPGTYVVCLTAYNSCGYDSTCQTITIGCPPISAAFGYNVSGSVVNFFDQSTNNPTYWYWNFGDGQYAYTQNPTHTYANNGVYTVCMTAWNNCDADTICQIITINCALPTGGFTYVNNGLTYSFTSQAGNGANQFYWNFGDGSYATSQNATHTYSQPGTYVVCLTAYNSCGYDSTCQTITIGCPPISAAFGYNVSGSVVNFFDQSTNNPTYWYWNFGDGQYAYTQNPTHTYANNGVYTVCMTAWNNCDADTICQIITINCALPTGGFTYTNSGLTYSFTSQAGNGANQFYWNFGDGSYATSQNATHTYNQPGNYVVCLTAYNSCGYDSTCQTITIGCPPIVAAFGYNVSGSTVTFFDQSTNNPTNWYWNFGDGQSGYTQNPTHTYANGGVYTVCMTAFNNCDADTICQVITVNCALPTGGFTYGIAGNSVYFTSQAGNGANQFYWNFGDGTNSTSQNPSHTYAQTGTYVVCLTAYNSCGYDSTCQLVTVSCPPIAATFIATVNGNVVNFLDISTNNPTNWYWDFGDGQYAYTQNPTHTYANGGAYTVCMTAWNSCDADTVCKTVTLNCNAPSAAFTYSITGNTVTFLDQSTNNPTYWHWYFGTNGVQSYQQNPTFTYPQPGVYQVCLIAENTCGTDSVCHYVNITCPPIVAGFNATVSNQTAVFTNNSTNNPTNWWWDFGDGQWSTVQHPIHTYSSSGTYTVCMTAWNSCDSDTLCKTVTINCPLPTGGFSFTTSGNTVYLTSLAGNGANQFYWNFGDGSFSIQQNPVHTYTLQGNYVVCMTAYNNCGYDSTCQTVPLITGLDEFGPGSAIEIFPNPGNGLFHLEAQALPEEIEILIVDARGRIIYQRQLQDAAGNYTREIDLSGAAQGTYHLRIQSEKGIYTRKLVIQ